MGFQIVQQKIKHKVSKVRPNTERYDLQIYNQPMCIIQL